MDRAHGAGRGYTAQDGPNHINQTARRLGHASFLGISDLGGNSGSGVLADLYGWLAGSKLAGYTGGRRLIATGKQRTCKCTILVEGIDREWHPQWRWRRAYLPADH